MNGKEITQTLRRLGSSVNDIAELSGVKPPTVSQVIHRVRPNPRIRIVIARAINRPVGEVFPSAEKQRV